MAPLVRENLPQISSLCARFHVERLELFGSAAGKNFHSDSDVDFLVQFEPVRVSERFENLLSFSDALKTLLDRGIDLVEEALIDNPYFLANIRAQREIIFERAHQPTHL